MQPVSHQLSHPGRGLISEWLLLKEKFFEIWYVPTYSSSISIVGLFQALLEGLALKPLLASGPSPDRTPMLTLPSVTLSSICMFVEADCTLPRAPRLAVDEAENSEDPENSLALRTSWLMAELPLDITVLMPEPPPIRMGCDA